MPSRGSTTARGYDSRHQAERARLKPTVDAGQAYCTEVICLMPSRWIQPDAHWDLAHDRARGGYLGPSHRRCNRAEGARWRHLKRRLLEAPPHWTL